MLESKFKNSINSKLFEQQVKDHFKENKYLAPSKIDTLISINLERPQYSFKSEEANINRKTVHDLLISLGYKKHNNCYVK